MHIIIRLNVARGRINHFPTPPPHTPTSAVYYHGDEAVSDLTALIRAASSRQFPSESLLVPAEEGRFWGGREGLCSLMRLGGVAVPDLSPAARLLGDGWFLLRRGEAHGMWKWMG